jgi:hypothetical protein
MSQNVTGTFISGQSSNPGSLSDALVIPTGITLMKLSVSGKIDASNTVKTQKSLDNGETWADVATYNSVQSNTLVTVAGGEQWRLVAPTDQPLTATNYSLSVES